MPKITKKKGIKKSRRNLKRKQTYKKKQMLKNKKIGGNNDTKHCTCNRNKDGTTATCECKSNTSSSHTYKNVGLRKPTRPLPPLPLSPSSSSVYTGLDPISRTSPSSQASSVYSRLNFSKTIEELKEEIEKLEGINGPLTLEQNNRLTYLGELLRKEEMKKRKSEAEAAAGQAAQAEAAAPEKEKSEFYSVVGDQGAPPAAGQAATIAATTAAEAAQNYVPLREQIDTNNPFYNLPNEENYPYDNLDYNTAGEKKIGQVRQATLNPAYIKSPQGPPPPEAAASVANPTYDLLPTPKSGSIPSETSTDPIEGEEPLYLDVAPGNLTARYDFTVEQKQNMLKQIQEKFDNLREENYEILLGTNKEETISIIKEFLNTYNTPEQVDLLVENLYNNYPELSSAVLGYSSAEDYVAALKKRRMTLDQDQLQIAAGKKSKKINKRKSKKNKRKSKKVKKSKSLKAK